MTIEKQAKICFTSSINKAKTKNGSKVWRTWRVKIRPCEKTPLGLYIDHVEYTLHESFETPRIVCYEEPYLVQQDGWGEFELKIAFYYLDQESPTETFIFDLNFSKPNYSEYKTLHLAENNEQLLLLTSLFNMDGRTREKKMKKLVANDHTINTRQRAISSASESCSSAITTPLYDQFLICYDDLYHHQQKSIAIENQQMQEAQEQAELSFTTISTQEHFNIDELLLLSPQSFVENDPNTNIIPQEMNMSLLATNLESLNDHKLREIYDILSQSDSLPFIETKDHVMFDLYSLDTSLLNQLWNITNGLLQDNIQGQEEE